MRKGVLLLILLIASISISQGQDSRIWTLQECIEYALENNLSVQRSLLGVEFSEIGRSQSKWSMVPSLNAGMSYGSSWGRTIDPTTNRFVTDRFDNSGISASTSLLLYQTSRLRNTFKQAGIDLETSKYDLEWSKNLVIFDVITFYTNVIFNRELYQNAVSQLNSTEQLLTRTEKQVEAGAAPQTQLYDLLAQKANNEVQVINAENNLNLSVLQLKQVIQLPGDQELEIEVPEIDLDVDDNPLQGLTAQDIYNIAMGEMPEIKSGDLGVESANLGVKIARAQLYPSLRVNGNLNTNYSSVRQNQSFVTENVAPFQIGTVNFDSSQPVYTLPTTRQNIVTAESYPVIDQWADNIGRSVSVTLSVPIFNGLSASSNVQRSRITRRQAEITSQERKNTLRQSIERAYNDVVGAVRSYDQSLKQVDAQEESFRVTERSYELGAMNFIDFQVAQNNLFEARTNLLLAKYDYIFKLKILDFYQGKPLEF